MLSSGTWAGELREPFLASLLHAVWRAPLHGPRLVSIEDHWSAGELGRQGRTSEQGECGGLVGEGWPTAALARMRPLPVHLLSNEDSQNSVLSSRFASRQGTMDAKCEDGQLKDVQRLMEERESDFCPRS